MSLNINNISSGEGYKTSLYVLGETEEGSGYVYIIPKTSGTISITIDELTTTEYDISASYTISMPSQSISLSGSATASDPNNGYGVRTQYKIKASGTAGSASGTVNLPTPAPFSIPFTKSIKLSGNGIKQAILFLVE